MKPLNLKPFSTARLRSLLRRIDSELTILNARITTIPANKLKAVPVEDMQALYAKSMQARAMLAVFDKNLLRFAATHPKLGSFQTRVNGAQMTGSRNSH